MLCIPAVADELHSLINQVLDSLSLNLVLMLFYAKMPCAACVALSVSSYSNAEFQFCN